MWQYVTVIITIISLLIMCRDKLFENDKSQLNDDLINKFRIYTKEEISQYNGVEKSELYLVILGNVFDVTKGAKYYGPGGNYHIFVGKDTSRSFVTGKFSKEDISEDVTGLDPDELRSLKHWVEFYKKEYTKVGTLIGKYYDAHGNLTPYGKEIKKLIKVIEAKDKNNKLHEIQYPPCNIEWTKDTGTRVWCTNRSGGIERSWIGVPRKYYQPGEKNYRCACIRNEHLISGNIEQYDDCLSEATSCFIKT